MSLMKIDVLHIAKLANLPLKKEEIEKYEKQLSSILEYIEKLQKVNTDNVKETSQVTNLENVIRDDAPTPSLSQDEALSNTNNKQNGLFKVKAIFE
jgi:aspartyl-tRNA(Asn)/glutamyl-tRNA(Gln) amidotransferase subunit C